MAYGDFTGYEDGGEEDDPTKPQQPGKLGNPISLDSLRQASGSLGDPIDVAKLRSTPTRMASDAVTTRTAPAKAPIDLVTGAPDNVRLAAAAAGTPDDQLAVVQRMMPNANVRRLGSDIVYDNPQGKATMVNPSLFSRLLAGKVKPSWAGAAETARDVTGGALGIGVPALASVAGPEATVGARLAMAGISNAVGNKVGQGIAKLANHFKGTDPSQDSRTVGDQAMEGLLDFGVGAGMEGGGMLMPKLLGAPAAALRGTRQGARSVAQMLGHGDGPLAGTTVFGGVPDDVADAMMRQNITRGGGPAAPLSMLSDGAIAPRVGNAVEQTFAGGPIQQAKEATRNLLESRVGEVASANAPPGTVQDLARQSRSAVRTNSKNFTDQVKDLSQKAYSGDQLIDPATVRATRDQMQAFVDAAPETRGPRYQAALDQLNGVLKDAAPQSKSVTSPLLDAQGNAITTTTPIKGAGIPVGDLKSVHSDIGELIGSSKAQLARTGKAGQAKPLADAYDAMSQQVRGALGDGTPEQAAHDDLMNLVKGRRDIDNPMREQIAQQALKAKDNAKASLNLIMQNTADQSGARAARIADLRQTTDPALWSEMQSSRLGQLGRDTEGAFTPEKFAKDLRSFTPSEQRAWGMTDSHMRDLSDLNSISQRLVANPSSAKGSVNNTLFTLNQLAGGLGAGVGAAASGGEGAVVGALAGPVALSGAQNAAARFLANPTLTRWLTTTYHAVAKSPNAWDAQLGRLLALKKLHPEESDAIDAYYHTAKGTDQ